MDKVFKYGAFEGRFDMSDFRSVERFDKAIKNLTLVKQMIKDLDDPIEKLKKVFYTYTDILDTTFADENAANLILGDSTSIDEAIDAVLALIAFANTQNHDMAKRWEDMVTQYTPNRAARRAASKKSLR